MLHLARPLIALALPSLHSTEAGEIYLYLNLGLLVGAATLPGLATFMGSRDGYKDLGVTLLEVRGSVCGGLSRDLCVNPAQFVPPAAVEPQERQ